MQQHTALAISLALEAPLVVILGVAGPRLPWWRSPQHPMTWTTWLRLGVAATLITHPFAWWLNSDALRGVLTLWPRMLTIEFGVTLIEALLFTWAGGWHTWRHGLIVASLANATSFGLGLVWFFFLAPSLSP
jgi:hypothetical protein